MMLIICKLYVWIHITWEAYVTSNVYWNKWLLMAPPECSLHGSQQTEAPLKNKNRVLGGAVWTPEYQVPQELPAPLKSGASWGCLLHTWSVGVGLP